MLHLFKTLESLGPQPRESSHLHESTLEIRSQMFPEACHGVIPDLTEYTAILTATNAF